MPSLLDDPYADPGQSRPPGLLGLDMPQIAQPDPDTDQGAALGDLYQRVMAEQARQQQISADRGLWTGGGLLEGGHPTAKGAVDAANQTAQGVMMGTTAPGAPTGAGFSLEKVQRRRTAPPNEHIWNIKDPAGENAGTIDTTWNPDTGNLHIEDFQSEGGPNALGLTAIRQLREALLGQYPGVQTLSGLRISGATYAHKPSGAGPGRYAIQDLKPE